MRFLAACALVSLAGCVTAGEGDRMRADIAELRQRLDAMEVRDRDITEKVAKLRTVLDEATALLGRNSADLGARVAKHDADIAAMTGKVEEAKYMVGELQKQVTEATSKVATVAQTQQRIVDRVAPTMPEDKESLWQESQKRLAEGQREEGRRFLRSFVQRFPSDARAPQAQLQIGIAFVQELKHSNAVAEFSNLIQRFPRSPEVPEAMWQLAESFVALKFCSDAKAMYQDLARRYPKSPRAKQVRGRLRDIQKIARDKRLCTS
ncbi:MAG: tetratricopeptide repeat protein [Deltaproteobacteria bacterium]|nr:tetratricopeptide repeat protein [Deltaproteobacteria bacterium]